MRRHEDFIPELDFVLEEDGRIIGNLMYTKAKLVNEAGREKEILTFGPICVEPEYQRQGYGKNAYGALLHPGNGAGLRRHRDLWQPR